jgi:hypothetical protein
MGRIRDPESSSLLDVTYRVGEKIIQLSSTEDIDPRLLARAARSIPKRRGYKLVVRTIASAASVYDAVREDIIYGHFDVLLCRGLLALGYSEDVLASLPGFGIGSEYRGFLSRVRSYAMRILLQRHEHANEAELKRFRLANEIVIVTSAVAFAMHDPLRPTWPLTLATGIKMLQPHLPESERTVKDVEPTQAEIDEYIRQHTNADGILEIQVS